MVKHRFLVSMAALCLWAAPLQALIVYDGGVSNTVNPGGGLPWSSVGDSGVYLGAFTTGYWVITANHVGSAGITLNGVYFNGVPGSGQRIGDTDLLLYRIDVTAGTAPVLPNLTLSNLTPAPGEPVVMVADGSGTMTWGTNTVGGYGSYQIGTDGPVSIGLWTDFSPVSGESQAQGGDSGGGLFYQHSANQWWLTGILSAVDTTANPNQTYSVALAYYYSDISAVVGSSLASIPEPAGVGAWLGAAAVAVAGWRRRRHQCR